MTKTMKCYFRAGRVHRNPPYEVQAPTGTARSVCYRLCLSHLVHHMCLFPHHSPTIPRNPGLSRIISALVYSFATSLQQGKQPTLTSHQTQISTRSMGLGCTEDAQTEEIDFFSSSQPVTTNTDRVLATSPASQRANIGLAILPMSVLKRDYKSPPALPNNPELQYKKISHGK
jgi:hypothetical protein